MALEWNLTDVTDYQTICWEQNLNPDRNKDEKYKLWNVTEAIIHLSTFTGISKITQSNYKELAKRLLELELIGMTLIPIEDDSDVRGTERNARNPTEFEVELHIGLSTNASRKDNRQWGNEIRRLIREQVNVLITQQREQELEVAN